MLTLLLSNDFILFWHFHKKICLKTFFEDKHFDPVNAFGPNTFQPWIYTAFLFIACLIVGTKAVFLTATQTVQIDR